MNPRRSLDPLLPRAIAARFFARTRRAAEPFWTIREIAKRFKVSPHAANAAVRQLVHQGVLVRHGRQGTSVATGTLSKVTDYQRLVRPHLAVVFPDWAAEAAHNSFGAELRTELLREAHAQQWNFAFYQEPGQWNDAMFSTRLLASGCTSLIAMNAADEAALTIAKLQAVSVPVVTIGRNAGALKMLKIPEADGNDGEAMYRLACQLLSSGRRRIVVAGLPPMPYASAGRMDGLRKALAQFGRKPPVDVCIESADRDYIASTLWQRLQSRQPPQAVICHDFMTLLSLLQHGTKFAARIKAGLTVAVFDHFFLDQAYPDLPLLEVTMDPAELARTAIAVLRKLIDGETVKPQTLIQYHIRWLKPARQ